ncbi:PAS domain S-box protein [Iningainema tapete]|uniref:histidine kinase n=1 Tax=Iningainema tapete BLCC-T55 TaxID=2748662 RepID=A0A8J6XQJ0_9CYAN|nr:PAS domain S-box protein [Iningainema tapete]MBD2774667.1 PAS domain S-box protein [Iningainema tapete BLCC-T55]
MHALAQLNSFSLLNSAIDLEPITVTPNTSLADVITLMCQNQPQATYVLVVDNYDVLGWLTEQDIVRLLYLGVDCKTTIISEVMVTSSIMLNYIESNSLSSVLFMLHQNQLPLLPVLDEQGKLFGCITSESICKALLRELVIPDRSEPTEERLKLRESAIDNTSDAIVITQDNIVNVLELQTEYQLIKEELAQTQIALKEANEQLEIRVRERTKALKEMNRQLVHEIADRQLAEEQLRQSQEMLQLIMDNIPQSIFWKDTSSVYLGCNRNFARIAGLKSPEDIVGKSDYDLVSKEQADFYHEFDALVMEADKPQHHVVTPHLRKDGKQIWLETNKVPFHDAEGNVVGVLGSFDDITKRREQEVVLREIQQQLQAILDNSPAIIYLVDTENKYLFINLQYEKMFKIPRDEIKGKSIYDYFPREFADRFAENNRKVLATGTSVEAEEVAPHEDGLHTYMSMKFPLQNTNGVPYAVCGISTDITERKQAEESVRLRDRAIAASSNGIVICDATVPDWPIIYANPAFERITGYNSAEVMGKNCRFLQGTDTNQPELETLRAALKEAKDCTVILRNYRKDGSLFWNELSISPVYDNNGKTHYIGILTDITERKQSEVALLVSQERLQYLHSSIPGVIYTCKPFGDYGITFVSENVITMTGYEVEEFLQDSRFWQNHIHPEDLTNMICELSKLYEQGHNNQEYRFLHQDGTYRWVYDQAKLVRDDEGNPLEIVGYWVEITQRKELEEELKNALEKEKELNELKSRFIAMTSHEFRTPLSTILSSAELLEHYRHKWKEEKQIIHLRRIQHAVKHLTGMLNDVLVIGKVEAGRLDFRPVPLDLVEYCRNLVEEIQLNVHNPHLNMQSDVSILFNSEYQSLPGLMDEKLLGHILSNLLSNAIKYSPTGSTVKFTLNLEQEQAVFEIQDQGIGIPEEDIPLLFESFYRATNVGNIPGTGLGLAIVKNCVDIHNGKITVTSKVGVGTKFSVILPMRND